jgi:hypothetical protein
LKQEMPNLAVLSRCAVEMVKLVAQWCFLEAREVIVVGAWH